MRLGAVIALASVWLAVGVPAGQAMTGQVRVLVVLATWGPTPFTAEEAQRVFFDETVSFYGASSGGRLTLSGEVVGPLKLTSPSVDFCESSSLERAVRRAAPSVDFDAFERVAWVVPESRCPWVGEAQGMHVVLNGSLTMPLAAHELGHTFGLGHASRWFCIALGCTVDEYGGGFSVMGGGAGGLNAYEKHQLGWLGAIAYAHGAATFTIAPIEISTFAAQALVVETAQAEYWFEARSLPTRSFSGPAAQPPGVVVLAGPGAGPVATLSPYPRANLVLANPLADGRFAYEAGETIRVPGAFEIAVERNDASGASLRFAWIDTAAPARPRLVSRSQRGRLLRVSWRRAAERGSGLAAHVLLVDGKPVRTLHGTALDAAVRLTRGRHTVGIVAVDRAGNRGPALSLRATAR